MSQQSQSNKKVILVTGATGWVGQATIRHLSSNDNIQIRALVHNKSDQLDLSNLSKNVTVVHGDLTDKKRLQELLDDVDRALLVCPNVSNQIHMEKEFITAAKSKKLDLLVKVSILSPMSMVSSDSPVGFAQVHAEAEKLLSQSGIPHVILRPNFFFENVLWFRDEILQNQSISIPCPGVPATMVAVDDVGKIAAELLSGSKSGNRFLGKELEIPGPESINFIEIGRRLSNRIGKEITVKGVDPDTLINNLSDIHLSEEMRKGLKPIFEDYWSKGAFDCRHAKSDLPCQPSINFDQWLDQNVNLFLPQTQSGRSF